MHLGHRHQQVLVGPAGQLPQHLGFAPADHDRRQRLADLLQPGIAGDAPGFVLDLMLVQQLPGRPQPMLIDELDDGDQFFQLVFQGRPGQHDRIGAIDAFQGARRDGVPVLHPLRFIDDDQFGRPGGDQVEIGLELLVVRDLAEIVQGVVLLPLRPAAVDDARRIFALSPREARDLALPLVFERGRADHQHFRDAKMPRQYFRRGDRLYGLAQSHVVADQRPAGPHREQRALGLIGIERHLQKRQQLGIGRAAREQLLELRGPPVRVPPSRDEIERIVIGAQLVTGLRRHGHERLELAEALVRKHPVAFGVEQTGGGLAHRRRAIRSGAKMHAAFAVIAQIQLGKCRLVAARERRLGAALFLQLGKREFDDACRCPTRWWHNRGRNRNCRPAPSLESPRDSWTSKQDC